MNSRHGSATIEVIEKIEIHVQCIARVLAFIKSRVDT